MTSHCKTVTLFKKRGNTTKAKVRINPKTGVLYVPKELLNDGFSGDVYILGNAMTFTVLHPCADLERVKESLEIALRDVNLRLKREQSSIADKTGLDYKGQVRKRIKILQVQTLCA